MANNKFQEAISEIVRTRRTNQNIKKRIDKNDEVLAKAAKLLRETGVRPYTRRKKFNRTQHKAVAQLN